MSNDAVEEFDHAGMHVRIDLDDLPESPREWDNVGKLLLYEHRHSVTLNELDREFRPGDYGGWDQMKKEILREYPGAYILPVYMYEHSGCAYNMTGFSCPWDSGQVGWIVALREKMLYECGSIRVTKKVLTSTKKYLEGEIATYSQWANGDVYMYTITVPGDTEEEYTDSCGGLFGLEYSIEAAKEAAEAVAKNVPSPEQRQRQQEDHKAAAAGQMALAI